MDLYFDCFSGISGDMTLGAFVDLGVPVTFLKNEITRLPLTGFDITVTPTSKHGIHAMNLTVHEDTHVHAMNYTRIKSLIEDSQLSSRVKALSLSIFEKIAEAESRIHGCIKEKVHFHEVGGIDAMVDIVGTALCMEYLDIRSVHASAIPLGSGFTTCAHGTIPIPAPATTEILKNVPVYGSSIKKELVTPTGAAIITSIARSFGDMPPMTITRTAYGSGKRDLAEQPNLLRVLAGKFSAPVEKPDTIVILESTIDDMNPEFFGFLMERLFEDGALDVTLQPVFMKKNRPGTLLSVLCKKEQQEILTQRILLESSTTGVRYYQANRTILERASITVPTRFGNVPAKQITRPDGSRQVTPEYDACRNIARLKNIPLYQVYEEVALNAKKTPVHKGD
ncbi:MAG: nickel pincer cofactor biosynthesis protein LarC [Proteobacteria bacterium]|nr:nickel pincer cofactor biosynthesis protein LarC [Pseudomonadota bacterium]